MLDGAIQSLEEGISLSRGSEVPESPRVSVIMPAYNTSQFIAEALDSVLAQTYPDLEAVVINDGSPDTEQLERAVEPYRDRIVYISQKNKRAAGARNTGIRHSRGEFLAFLDSDDLLMPEALAVQMKKFAEDPSLDMVYGNAEFLDSMGPETTYMEQCPSTGPVTFESMVNEETQVCIVCAVARKAVVLKAGCFNETLRRCDDYDMWVRVAYVGGRISYHGTVVGKARMGRPGSLGTSELGMLEAAMDILSTLEKELPLSKEQKVLIQRRFSLHQARHDTAMAKGYLARGDYESAAASLAKANAFFKSPKLTLVLLGLRISPKLVQGIEWARSLRARR